MTRSLAGLGFNGYRVPSRSGAVAANTRQAGGSTHLAVAAPSDFAFQIAPNRIPVRNHLQGMGFAYGGDTADFDYGFSNGDGGFWDDWSIGPSFSYPGTGSGGGGGYYNPGSSTGSGGSQQQQQPPGPCSFITSRDPATIVNQIEPLLIANLAAYQAGQKTQAAALAYFDQMWSCIQQTCGAACTTDRQAGATKWHDAAGLPWNWFSGYRDIIARGASGGTGTTGTGTTILPGVTLPGDSSLYLLAAGFLILMMAASGGKH